MNQRPRQPKATRAARNGELQPPPANVHTLPRMRVSPQMATALYYSRYPHAIPPNSTVTSGEMDAARMVAAVAHHNLTRYPERYMQGQPRQRQPQAGPAVAKILMKMHRDASAAAAADGRAPGAVGAGAEAGGVPAAVNTNNNGEGNSNGNINATTAPATAVGQDLMGFVALDGYEDFYSAEAADAACTADNDQPTGGDASPSPIELNINTGVTVSQSDNMVVLAASPADVAGGVAAAVLAAIEQASSGRVGIPMIDESGVPRPLRVRVDAVIRVGGSGNVLGPEALLRECLLARAANGGAGALPREPAAAAVENGKRAREEAEEWVEEDNDAESVGSKKSRSA